MSLTHSAYQVLEMSKTLKKRKRRKRVALTIKNKLEVCKMVKKLMCQSLL